MAFRGCCEPKDYGLDACKSRMQNCPNYKAYPRVYLQFNEVVFNGIESVESASLTGDFKIATNPYPFKHGSYYGGSFQGGTLLMGEQDLSIDLRLPFAGMKMQQVRDYKQFILYNFTRAGKIWAVDTGGQLIWANAIPKHPPYDDYDIKDGRHIKFSMDFTLPDGVWHIADTKHVYLEPYDLCDMKDSFGVCDYHDCNLNQQCIDEDCNMCGKVTEDMNFCNTCWNPYDNCNNPYRIVYNCAVTWNFLGHLTYGEQFIGDCHCLVGTFCVNTIYDAAVTVSLEGKFEDPVVIVNDTKIRVKGTYDGRLEFLPNGTVNFYREEYKRDMPICPKPISFDLIEYPSNKVGFYAHRGTNTIQVLFGKNSSDTKFAYVDVDQMSI